MSRNAFLPPDALSPGMRAAKKKKKKKYDEDRHCDNPLPLIREYVCVCVCERVRVQDSEFVLDQH